MSLVVWMPLNGNVDNNGVGNISISGSQTYDNTGKIGKCLNSSATTSVLISELSGSRTWSVAFWGYVTSSLVTSNWTRIMQIGDGSSNLRIEVCPSSYANGIYCYSTHNNTGYKITTASITDVSGGHYDKWMHFCITSDGTTIRVYRDGVLSGSCGYDGSGTVTGGFTLENNDKIKKNDFRVYNTCLSPKEIEVLAHGLVLHYPMTGGGRGQANLYDFETVASKWTNEGMTSLSTYSDATYGNVLKFTNTSANVRMYRSVSNVWTTATTYTVSFMARAATSGTIINMSRSIADFSPNFTLSTDWKYYSGQISNTTSTTGGTLSVRTVSGTGEVYLANVKVEIGSIATPYIPGVGDSHYTSMGYNDNTEYDVSGYLHNGTTSGVSYSSDSARYSVSTVFDANADTVTVPSAFSVSQTMRELSVCIWFKSNTLNSTSPNFFSLGENAFIRARTSNGQSIWCYYRTSTETTAVNMRSYTFSCKNILDNNWHHLVCTFKDGISKCYIDGSIIGTNDNTSDGLYLMCSSTAWHLAGYAANAENFIGSLSDFRLYATALSAEDIQKLYNTSASLANNGTLMAYEFTEM